MLVQVLDWPKRHKVHLLKVVLVNDVTLSHHSLGGVAIRLDILVHGDAGLRSRRLFKLLQL